MLRSQGTLFTIVFVGMFGLADAEPANRGGVADRRAPDVHDAVRASTSRCRDAGNSARSPTRPRRSSLCWPVCMRRANGTSGWRGGTRVPFGQADPLLGRDVAFYVFTLPFLEFVRSLLQTGDRHRCDRVWRSLLPLRQPRLGLPRQVIVEPRRRAVISRCWPRPFCSCSRLAPGCVRPST